MELTGTETRNLLFKVATQMQVKVKVLLGQPKLEMSDSGKPSSKMQQQKWLVLKLSPERIAAGKQLVTQRFTL